MKTSALVAPLLMAAAICIGCNRKVVVSKKPIGVPIKVKVPLGLPPLPVPADNPVTAETVALGRKLFYDRKLSADNTISCSNCHSPQLGFTDGRKHSTGVGERPEPAMRRLYSMPRTEPRSSGTGARRLWNCRLPGPLPIPWR